VDQKAIGAHTEVDRSGTAGLSSPTWGGRSDSNARFGVHRCREGRTRIAV
jgi:hypothetical protein